MMIPVGTRLRAILFINAIAPKRAPTYLVLLLLTQAAFPDYQSGLDAYNRGDFTRAITEWQAVVESPPGTVDPAIRAETLYAIGMIFWLGQGVQQDTRESASWLQLAAEMHHPGAQTKLGFLYSKGQGVRQSNFEAFKWWQMAANQGDADAQYNLGVLYRDGLGVEPNPEESMKWFREAAMNGDPISAGIVAQHEAIKKMGQYPGGSPLAGEQAINTNRPQPASNTIRPVSAATAPKPVPSTANEDWIRQREPEHYTIQVIALSQPEKLQHYIQQHQDWAPFAIYGQTRYETPLWVLVQGDYVDLGSARQAVISFPQDMQARENLWIRRFQMVQSLLE
jgi:TPR repeat protein